MVPIQYFSEHVECGIILLLFIKQSQSLLEFKTNIKTLRNIECSCKYVKYRKILAEKGWLLLA